MLFILQVSILSEQLISSYLPVHLISPSLYPPDTLIRHFSHSPSGETSLLLPVTYVWHYYQAVWYSPTPALQFSIVSNGRRMWGGREGVIRCTGRYDNISFRIKTLYWHTQPVHLISPINNILLEEGSHQTRDRQQPTSKYI